MVTLEPPRSARTLSLAASVLLALALMVNLSSLHLNSALVRFARSSAQHRRLPEPTRPSARLGTAIEDLSRRQRVPLFIAPGLDVRALREPLTESADGSLRESVRALDAYAAGRGLWLHLDDGVLRLDREVRATEMDCDGSLDECATRLERLASVTIQRSAARDLRPVHLRVSRASPVVESTRLALVGAGYQVDVIGRTLYVAGGPTDAGPPAARETDRGIRAVGRGVYVLTRRALDELMRGPHDLMRSTRILPESRGDRVVGVRVFGIRRGDLLSRLGVANGDVIRRVNGLDVASPDRCLEAYSRLRRVDEVAVELERGGRTITLLYVIA